MLDVVCTMGVEVHRTLKLGRTQSVQLATVAALSLACLPLTSCGRESPRAVGAPGDSATQPNVDPVAPVEVGGGGVAARRVEVAEPFLGVRIVGTVVGHDGASVADATVVLCERVPAAYRGDPATAETEIRIVPSAGGRFEHDWAAGRSAEMWIRADAGPYLASVQRHIDRSTLRTDGVGGAHTRIDLGNLPLTPAGALSFTVEPRVEQGIRLELVAELPELHRQVDLTATDAVVGGIVPGRYDAVFRVGQTLVARHERVLVLAGVTSALGTVKLTPVPRIRGRLVDSEGNPIAHIRLTARSLASGAQTEGLSDLTGSFDLSLDSASPHLVIPQSEEYVPESPEALARPVEVNAAELVIRMRRDPLVEFLVLDAESEMPIQAFDLQIESARVAVEPTSIGTEQRVITQGVRSRANGRQRVSACVGEDRYRVTAVGYAAAEGPVRLSSDAGACVIRLTRAPSVSGMLLLGGQPARSATVSLYAGAINTSPGASDDDLASHFWSPLVGRVDPWRQDLAPRRVTTDSAGAFQFAGVESGEYTLVASLDGAMRVVSPVIVPSARTLHLGGITLRAAGSIQGRALLPAGIDASGIRVRLHSHDREWVTDMTSDATFTFHGVPAGPAHLELAPSPGKLAYGDAAGVRVPEGTTAECVVDARDRAGCFVSAHVLADGQPKPGWRVELLAPRSRPPGAQFPPTDATGASRIWCNAFGEVDARVLAPSGATVGRFSRVADLRAGGEFAIRLECVVGGVSVRLPSPERSRTLDSVELEWESVDAGIRFGRVIEPVAGQNDADLHWLPPNGFAVDALEAGEYRLRVVVREHDVAMTSSQRTYAGALRVVAGSVTHIELKEADIPRAR